PAPGSGVVTVSSSGHRPRARINFGDLQSQRSYRRVAAYSQSKLANLMFTYELQRRLSGAGTTVAVAAHPGLASTELTRNSPAIAAFFYVRAMRQKAAMGALPVLHAATDPGVLGGQYYGPGPFFGARGYPKPAGPSRQSHETAIQRRLWTRADRGHVPDLTLDTETITGATTMESVSRTGPVHYRTAAVGGVSVFYREAGPERGPVVLLLHGFPSSSRMFPDLIPRLADAYHLIAPDYPAFGHSAVPGRSAFGYTFDHLAGVVDGLLDQLGTDKFAIYVMD